MHATNLPRIAIETLADTDDARIEAEQSIADLQPSLQPASISPNQGFMIDQDGNRVGSIYTTPRPCLRCGTPFIPPRTWKRTLPTTCSEPCRRRYAVKQITAIGQEAAARKRTILPARPLYANIEPSYEGARFSEVPITSSPPLVTPAKTTKRPNPSQTDNARRVFQERRSNGQFGKSVRPAISITRKDAHRPEAAFGRSLRKRRLAAGLTMTHLGELMGRHRNAVNNWERNAVVIPADMLAQLAQILNCTMEELWYDR